jgi:hypothetical protein
MDFKQQLINEITKQAPDILNNINKIILKPLYLKILPYIIFIFSLIIILLIMLIYIIFNQYKLSKYILP